MEKLNATELKRRKSSPDYRKLSQIEKKAQENLWKAEIDESPKNLQYALKCTKQAAILTTIACVVFLLVMSFFGWIFYKIFLHSLGWPFSSLPL